MPFGRNAHVVMIAISVAIASSLLWLGAEYRPDGLLAVLRDALQPVYVFPYLLGVVLGGNAHAPRVDAVFAGLLIEAYLVAVSTGWLAARTSAALQRGQGRGSE